MKTEILKILKQCNGFVSGQDLCEQFQVSRTAVWKMIKQLQQEGCRIEAVRNKGYRLLLVADVMTEAEIGSQIQTRWLGRCLKYFEVIDSTNTKAKQLAEQGAEEGLLVVADSQQSGKGRRGKSWSSPPGENIFMSFVLRPDLPPQCAPMITLLAGLAVAGGIRKLTGLKAEIKWPNDIVVQGQKVCGILTEMSAELEQIHYVVTGIGINVNTDCFPAEIAKTATSIRLQTGEMTSRSQLIAVILSEFEQYYQLFLQTNDMSLLKAEYQAMLVNKNRQILVTGPGHKQQGLCLGINDKGELLMEGPDGQVKEVMAGEVSVRGVYGYV